MNNLDKYTFPSTQGKLLSTEDHANGNMLRSTAEFILLAQNDVSLQVISDYFKGIVSLQVRPGVFSRYTDKLENTSVDDYLAVGCISQFAANILDNARPRLGFADLFFPKVSISQWLFHFREIWQYIKISAGAQWLFRFQGLWQHLKLSAGESLGLLGQAIWSLSLYLAAKEPITNQDNWTLSHMMVLVYERSPYKHFLMDIAVRFWKSKKTKPTSQIFAEYCGISDHPLVQAWKKYD